MKFKKLIQKLIVFSVLSAIGFNVFADSTTPEPYNTKEFPQALKDLRRFEIITLGSMPFVMLDVEIGYAGYLCVKNDFDTEYLTGIFGSKDYTEEEQKKIILTSLGISAGIGVVDFVINKIKSSFKKKTGKVTGNINVIPIEEDPDATRIIFPYDDFEQNTENSDSTDEIEILDEVIEVIE